LQGQDIFEYNGRTVIKIHAAKRGFERLHPLHFDADAAFDMSPLIELAKRRPVARLFGGTSRQFFNLVLKQACSKAGIHTDAGHSHIFRHSISMVIWHQTKNLGALSHFLAHKSPASAFAYLQVNNGLEAQKAVDNLQLV
jgi:integrase